MANELDSSDVILWLLPHRGEGFDGAVFATAKPENRSRFVAARQNGPEQLDISRQERGGTELPVEYGLFENTDCLVFRFSHGARTSVGVVGGCAPNADFALQSMPGVSKYHFALTFNDENRPILRDLGSTGGTKVTYNGEEGQRLSNFDWPLRSPSIANGKPPILNITDLLQFKVILPDHDYTSPEYVAKVKQFHTGTEDPENLFASLIIQSAQATRLPSGQQTPSSGSRSRPIFYKKQIGKGAYGVVIFVWNLATGKEYVVKRPLSNLIKSRKFVERHWKREADIMQSISHEHIVAFLGATFSSYPRLKFEYVRGGSLDSYTDLSTFESTQVLAQLSSALEYLHNRDPSIGHRDIKPENVLVHGRGANGIRVKFGDFGLSKAADVLKTCCGTLLWAAPEVYLKVADPLGAADDTYGVAVDVWSLGAVIAWLECGLPEYEDEWKTDAVGWIHALQSYVVDKYQAQGNELLWLVTDSMLVEDPDERSSADYVTTEAGKLLQSMAARSDGGGSATPTPSVPGAGYAVGIEGLDGDSAGEEGETRRLLSSGPETPQSLILPTIEVETPESTVVGLLQGSGGREGAGFTSSNGSDSSDRSDDRLAAVTQIWNAEATQTEEDPQVEDGEEEEEEDDDDNDDDASLVAGYLIGGVEAKGEGVQDAAVERRRSRSMHKRSRLEESPSLSLPRSLTYPPSVDQQRATSRRPTDHKRIRREGLSPISRD